MIDRRLLGTAVVALLMSASIAACGELSAGSTSPASSTTGSATPSPAPSVVSSTTVAVSSVPAEELTQAEQAAVTFVDSLGRGDLDAAAAVVGPTSLQQTNTAGGLRSLLQQSTEGHGAWIGTRDRVVMPVGITLGLVVDVLEGTLQVEGNTEHRVAAFPVRKAESGVWLVEPWAREIGATPPLIIRSPEIDAEDQARVASTGPVEVRVETALGGTVWAVFDDGMPERIDVASGERSTRLVGPATRRVVVLFDAGHTLYATAFSLVDVNAPEPTVSPTTRRASPVISIPLVSYETNQLLRSCAAGNDASCDGAQVPGVLDHRAFSYIRERCAERDQIYCRLLDHLVEAAQRLNARQQ
jgi:hypothetical protein